MFTRPKPSDNEEDILAMQEAYMREKEKNKEFTPSAKVVNLRKHKSPTEPSTSAKQSKYAQSKGLNKKTRVTFHEETTVIGDVSEKETEPNVEDDKVYYPDVIPSVLGDIIERNYDRKHFDYKPSSSAASGGFPSPKKRDSNNATSSKITQDKKRSPPIAMEDIEYNTSEDSFNNSGESGEGKVSSHEDSLNMSMESVDGKPVDVTSKYFEKSAILQGDNAMEIHNENKNVIEKMSEEELLQEREKLISTLDPKILDYIKSLRNKRNECTKNKEQEIKFVEKCTTNDELKKETNGNGVSWRDLSNNDVIQHPDLKKWLHFDTLEADKLQWIQNVEEFHNYKNSNEPYEARFNFKGYLQPYTMEYTEETKTLFHHGEDPHRPGYSLNELFQLCRSTVTQQRVLALNTIAGILEYNSIGIYENIIEIPITKIYFILRFALDENIPVVLEPTLKALRNMFYNKIDEACLDFLLCTEKGLIQPRLVSSKSEKNETDTTDVSEIKDFHLVDLDLVKGAIRTDIIPRLRYILTTVKPSLTCVECIIQIFGRIFRDSVENAELLFNTEGLMDFIFENYIPKYISNASPSGQDVEHCKIILDTLKMVRIAVSQSKAIAEICCSKYNIFVSLLNYIGNVVVENTILLKIQIETFYLWSCFVHYGLGLGCMSDIKGLLLRVLDNHAKGTDLTLSYPVIMHSHVAALITLLTNARLAKEKYRQSLPEDYFNDFVTIMLFTFKKWSSQIGSFMSYTAGHLKSVSALLTFMSTIHELEFEKFDKIPEINFYIQEMFQCDGFLILSSNLVRNSNLLATVEVDNYTKKVTETNNPGLNASLISKSQNVLPLVTVSSPICFLVSLSKYILISKNKRLHWEFIQHNVIIEYIKAISTAKKLNLSDNWFTKIELDFLCNIIYLSVDLEDVSDPTKEILYSFAFKLTYILSAEYKPILLFILERIVFNRGWFTTERLLRNLDIEDASSILNHLKDIFECYRKVLNLHSFESSTSLTATNWSQKVLPRDWIFMPILGLYSKSQELENMKIPKELEGTKQEQINHIITCSLKWILVSEIYFPEITNEISLTDRFCRLCCVFLCDNSLFLDKTIKPLLWKCIKIIFNIENSPLCYGKFNFDRSVLGINSFQDFYTQLVDQFQAVSYGDPTFAACILVPLAQKHNIKWRKLVWSEYAACLRALDCPKEYLCYRIEQYLDPLEVDFSLLKCYHQGLVSNLLRPGTIVYQIAQNHVEYAKRRQKCNPK